MPYNFCSTTHPVWNTRRLAARDGLLPRPRSDRDRGIMTPDLGESRDRLTATLQVHAQRLCLPRLSPDPRSALRTGERRDPAPD